MKAVVAERGQVTIPKALRQRLGIVPGTSLDFHEDHGKLVAQKVAQSDPVAEAMGCLKPGKSTDRIMAELRGDA